MLVVPGVASASLQDTCVGTHPPSLTCSCAPAHLILPLVTQGRHAAAPPSKWFDTATQATRPHVSPRATTTSNNYTYCNLSTIVPCRVIIVDIFHAHFSPALDLSYLISLG